MPISQRSPTGTAAVTMTASPSSSNGMERAGSTASTSTTTAPSTTVPPPAGAAGTIDTPDGRTRTYRTYVPAGVGTDDVPLVIALHGGTGSGAKFERSSGLDEQADLHGFVVVYPDGVGNGPDETGMRTWW